MNDQVKKLTVGVRLLETLTSALYENPIVIFREYIQNSVDSFNDTKRKSNNINCSFIIDINIDFNEKRICIFDNGHGIKSDNFLRIMKTIGDSDKDTSKNIGFRGIGRLSALPFCNELTFRNKTKGSKTVQAFTFSGDKYKELLNSNKKDLSEEFDKITKFNEEPYTGDVENHFFEVVINGIKEDLEYALSENESFTEKLSLLLPIDYSPTFSPKTEIHNMYKDVFNKDLSDYAYDINYNGKKLCKPYTNDHINESGIIFKEFKVKGETYGFMWYSFNRVFDLRRIQNPKGIIVRSKNVQMGDTASLVKDAFRTKVNIFTTERELGQTLLGLSGELLIDTDKLSDNARRDWFRMDDNLIMFSKALNTFFKDVKEYRYIASEYSNKLKKESSNPSLINELRKTVYEKSLHLFSQDENKIINVEFIEAFENPYKRVNINPKADNEGKSQSDNGKNINEIETFDFDYAKFDIPGESERSKQIYNFFMNETKRYFIEPDLSTLKREEYIKLNLYLKRKFSEYFEK